MKPDTTWKETLYDKYEDKGDERYGLVKHNNTILQNILDDFQDILSSSQALARREGIERTITC